MSQTISITVSHLGKEDEWGSCCFKLFTSDADTSMAGIVHKQGERGASPRPQHVSMCNPKTIWHRIAQSMQLRCSNGSLKLCQMSSWCYMVVETVKRLFMAFSCSWKNIICVHAVLLPGWIQAHCEDRGYSQESWIKAPQWHHWLDQVYWGFKWQSLICTLAHTGHSPKSICNTKSVFL